MVDKQEYDRAVIDNMRSVLLEHDGRLHFKSRLLEATLKERLERTFPEQVFCYGSDTLRQLACSEAGKKYFRVEHRGDIVSREHHARGTNRAQR